MCLYSPVIVNKVMLVKSICKMSRKAKESCNIIYHPNVNSEPHPCPLYSNTSVPPTAAPATTSNILFTCSPRTQFVKLSSGPKMPPAEDAPGLGAPPEPLPPPLTSVGAVGNGPVDVELVEVLLPLVVPFPLVVLPAG